MRLAVLGLLPLTLWASIASGQEGDRNTAAGEEIICLAIGHRWSGNNDDARDIESRPVPESFSRIIDAGGCGRFQLMKESLLDWHIAFGSERSAAAALAYLANEFGRTMPPPTRYAAALQRAWREALPDFRRAASIRQRDAQNHSAAYRFLEESRRYRRWREQLVKRDDYMLLAEQFLRAAAEFESLPFLIEAERYLQGVVEADRWLAALATEESDLAPLLGANPGSFDTVSLEMRSAVLGARLTRAPADIARAQMLLQSAKQPLYRRVAEAAYSGGRDFCDVDDGWGQAEEIEAACREEDDFNLRVVDYWLSRASLDLLTGREEEHSYELALRLLEQETAPDAQRRCCRRNAEEDILRLLMQRAGHHHWLLDQAITARDENEVEEQWRAALTTLRRAERLTPPFQAPSRFRRIAEHWRQIWGRGQDLFVREENRSLPTDAPDFRRYVGYLNHTLNGLRAIATGDGLPFEAR